MIDLQTENVVSLREACQMLSRRRAGKRPHVATLYRCSVNFLLGILRLVGGSVSDGMSRCGAARAPASIINSG